MTRAASASFALALATGLAVGAPLPAPAQTPATESLARRVSLDEAARARLDLATAPAETGDAPGEVVAYGRVLDPMPLADAAVARAVARRDASLALRERDRVRELSRDRQNASDRELEAAEAALDRAKLDFEAAEARLRSGWGSALADSRTLEADLAGLAARRVALARIDLPVGAGAGDEPSEVHVFTVDPGRRALASHLVGPAPSADPLLLGRGFLLWIERDPPPPGAPLSATLVFPSLARRGWWVPESALVRVGGHACVWVERESGVFERRDVEVQRAAGSRRLVAGALAAGDAVVVRGALELLATANARPAGD